MEMWCTPCLGHVRQVSISCLIHCSSSQRLSHTSCHLSTSPFFALNAMRRVATKFRKLVLAFWQLSLYLEGGYIWGDISYQLQTSGWSWWYDLGGSMDFPYWIYHDTGGFVSSCSSEFQKWFNENIFSDHSWEASCLMMLESFSKRYWSWRQVHASQQGTPVAPTSDDSDVGKAPASPWCEPWWSPERYSSRKSPPVQQHPSQRQKQRRNNNCQSSRRLSSSLSKSLLVFSLKWVSYPQKRQGFGWNIIFETYQKKPIFYSLWILWWTNPSTRFFKHPRLVCHQLLTHEVHLVPEEMDKSWREMAIFRISFEEGKIYYIPIHIPIQLLLMIPLISIHNF